jgi:RNA polymerase sigma-70 factor (ECF subfamily)
MRGATPVNGDPRATLIDGFATLRLAIAAAVGPGAIPATTGPSLAHASWSSPLPARGRGPAGALAAPVTRPAPQRGLGDPPATPATGPDGVPTVITRAQAGDGEAFAELYDRYVGLVYRYVYYRVSSVSLAEDLTSETFLRALRRLPSFQWQGRDFGAWLVTIARNLIADHYKSSRYRLEITAEDVVLAANAHATTEGPEREVIESLTNATLLEAVKRLGTEQQECIVLRFLQGLSVAETALAMGKNEGAIKALQYRAVRTLGRMLPPDLAE